MLTAAIIALISRKVWHFGRSFTLQQSLLYFRYFSYLSCFFFKLFIISFVPVFIIQRKLLTPKPVESSRLIYNVNIDIMIWGYTRSGQVLQSVSGTLELWWFFCERREDWRRQPTPVVVAVIYTEQTRERQPVILILKQRVGHIEFLFKVIYDYHRGGFSACW